MNGKKEKGSRTSMKSSSALPKAKAKRAKKADKCGQLPRDLRGAAKLLDEREREERERKQNKYEKLLGFA